MDNGTVGCMVAHQRHRKKYFRMVKFFKVRVLFFFKQKTAYEITTRLVGSEMCIRDSIGTILFSKDIRCTGQAQVS